jgi:PleD family two-component response regulator
MDIRFEVTADDFHKYCEGRTIEKDDDLLRLGRQMMLERTGNDLWFYFDSRRQMCVGIDRIPTESGIVDIHPEDMDRFRYLTEYKELEEDVDVDDWDGVNAAMKRYGIERFGKEVPVWFDSESTYWFKAKIE